MSDWLTIGYFGGTRDTVRCGNPAREAVKIGRSMSDTLTIAQPIGDEEGGLIVRGESYSSSVDALPCHNSDTPNLARTARNVMLPLLFGLASFGSPAPPGVRRVFADASISESALLGPRWVLSDDLFRYTEETADAAQVRALNALLDLPVVAGLELDLPD